ncbi:MAG: hypothetical protein IJ759_00040 [Bacteroidales bacterium]|nr:hypothetical protein [Bacteroidales bacterium]
MNDWILQIGLPILTAVLGVWSGNYMTKRQKKKSDLELMSEGTQSMLNTINGTLQKIDDLTSQVLDLKNENTQLKTERLSLNLKIDKLTKEVEELKQVINRMAKEKRV